MISAFMDFQKGDSAPTNRGPDAVHVVVVLQCLQEFSTCSRSSSLCGYFWRCNRAPCSSPSSIHLN
jgi:hypothetical protein